MIYYIFLYIPHPPKTPLLSGGSGVQFRSVSAVCLSPLLRVLERRLDLSPPENHHAYSVNHDICTADTPRIVVSIYLLSTLSLFSSIVPTVHVLSSFSLVRARFPHRVCLNLYPRISSRIPSSSRYCHLLYLPLFTPRSPSAFVFPSFRHSLPPFSPPAGGSGPPGPRLASAPAVGGAVVTAPLSPQHRSACCFPGSHL